MDSRSYTWSVRRSEAGSKNGMQAFDPQRISQVATDLLREAIRAERSKRWKKVTESYSRMIKVVHPKGFPDDYKCPPSLSMLLYECHYHMGMAYQHLGDHKKAVTQFTKAIQAVFIPKNGCRAGCSTNSCLMTPLYARRAFANTRSGDLKAALNDAEKGVVLDSSNPDVFCIRALVRSSRDEDNLALQDIDKALGKNSRHLCALILKGTLARPLIYDNWEEIGIKKEITNEHHKMACSINPDCHTFLNVRDFTHPDIFSFYDRFLYSLNVPHTISEVSLPPYRSHSAHKRNRPSTGFLSSTGESSASLSSFGHSRSISYPSLASSSERTTSTREVRPFRSGTPAEYKNAHQNLSRRKDYGNQIREVMSRPKTAEQYIEFLTKEKIRLHLTESAKRKTHSLSSGRNSSSCINSRGSHSSGYGNQTRVFCTVNIKDAPRMYYRPWLGDKLPVAEVERRQPISPPFKV